MRRNIWILCLTTIVLVVAACKKDDGFGSDLLPAQNPLNLKYDDTTALTVSSKFEDPLRTDRILFNYLGHIENSVFGKTTASTTIQYGLPSELDTALAPFTLKDVNLYLFYDGFVGDTTAPVSLSVHTLTAPINTSIIYYSNYIPNYNFGTIGQLDNFLIKPTTPQKLRDSDTVLATGFIKIPIDFDYGLAAKNLLETGNITNDTLLESKFPGIYIQANPSQLGKTMLQLDLTQLSGGVYLNLVDKNGDDQIFILPFSTSNFTHTSLIHDYQGTTVNNAIASGEFPAEDKFYMESQAGVKTEVKFNHLEKFKGKLINKAVVEIYEVEKPQTNFDRIYRVYPLMKGSNGENVAIDDYNSTYYGPAALDTSKTGSDGQLLYKYEVNITHLMKNYAIGKQNFESIYLTNYPVFDLTPQFILGTSSVLSQHIEPASLIIGGPNYSDSEKRMKLKVWYSESTQ